MPININYMFIKHRPHQLQPHTSKFLFPVFALNKTYRPNTHLLDILMHYNINIIIITGCINVICKFDQL